MAINQSPFLAINRFGDELDVASLAGDQYKTTSTTCQDIVSTGNITLTVAAGLAYTPLQDIIVYADASNHMHGEVVSYNTVTGELVMNVHQKSGSGNFCNWTVNLDAIKLAQVSVYYGSTDPVSAGQAGVEGDLWYKTSDGTGNGTITEAWVYDDVYGWKLIDSAITPLDVLTTAQPTPTATGNTTNLNTAFKDTSGNTWIVDSSGDAVLAAPAAFKEQNRFYADPNGSDATGTGANENPYATAQAAVSALSQADTAVLNEGTYGDVTMATQNTTLSGASNGYAGLVNIASLTATANGTSVRAEGLTVVGNVTHSGTAPLYLNNVTVNGNYTSSSTAYTEIKDSRIQAGAISKTAAGALFIRDSQIGAASFTTAGSQIVMRDVAIDLGDCVTIGAGVVYSLSGVQGCVNIDPAAIPGETAAIAGGATPTAAEAAATTLFNNVRITNPDTEASPTKYVTWDEATGELEVSNAPADITTTVTDTVTGHKIATYTNEAGTAVDINETTTTVTDTVTGHKIATYTNEAGTAVDINETTTTLALSGSTLTYTDETGTATNITIPSGAKITFGTTTPPTASGVDGEEYFVTSDGTSNGTVTEQWIYDLETTKWVQRPAVTSSALTTTSLTPKVYSSGWTDAQANTAVNVAQLVQLSDGSYLQTGKVTWTGHGFPAGSVLYLSQTNPGQITTTVPTSGWVQMIGNVEDANTIHVDVEPAEYIDISASGTDVFVNTSDPNSATVFDTVNPPATNNDALKQVSTNIYYGTDGSVWLWNGTAYITKTYSYAIHQRDKITATASQTSFTISKTPIGGTEMVMVTRNGVDISDAFTWVGKTGTYVPANNGSKVMDAGDVIRFHYEAL